MPGGTAQAVYDALNTHGALFFDDLLAATKLLPAHVEDALRELAALGLVTSDGFTAVRSTIVKHAAHDGTPHRVGRRSVAGGARRMHAAGGGRNSHRSCNRLLRTSVPSVGRGYY